MAHFAQFPLGTVARAGAPAFYDHLMSYLAGERVRPAEIIPVSDFASAVALAAAGSAWAVVPSSTAIDQALVRLAPMHALGTQWQVGLMRLPGEPAALVGAFWEVVADIVMAQWR